ncbi:S-adenosyl-L-methionine-dependent methyltransferase [Phellopilus nigrolimitatus]|nr:S-adenosyl-L-methionine-dependent methyltransferase [Phellopilus nigrolimitatus]
MATFSKATFNTAKYAAARPTYPRQLFDFVFRYHEQGSSSVRGRGESTGKARWDAAVDLGCGTGQATIELHPFKRVVGVDPSAKMLDEARQYVTTSLGGPGDASISQFDFVQSPAESLGFLEDGSVDLVVSAQAAHWFDWKKLWPELARILRKNGTVAFWGYSEMRLSGYPLLTPLINAYSQGSDPATSLGPHWEQPGRSIVDNHLQDVPSATSIIPDAFYSEERVYFSGSHYSSLPSPRPVILRKKMNWENFEAYLRSFSSLHTFQARYPADATRENGDIVTRFTTTLKEKMYGTDQGEKRLDVGEENEIEVEWPLALVLVKRV